MGEEKKKSEILIFNDFWPRWSEMSINEIKFSLIEPKKNAPKKRLSELDKVPPFTDKEVCILPIRYQEEVYCWKRPVEIFEESEESKNIILSTENSEDLRKANLHLKFSSYYYNIMDAFNALIMYKNWMKEDFKDFGFPNWKPLNHIYSGSKISKGVPHDVTVNDHGKYGIRLFHCGAWRLIIVDDRMPVNNKNQILMPCIRTETTLQLWPILITKAILKINFCRMEDEEFYIDQRHTPQCRMYDGGKTCKCKIFLTTKKQYLHEEKNLNRLNIIYALTGWFPLETELSGCYKSDAWNFFSCILENYKIPEKPQPRRSSGKTEKVKKPKATLGEVEKPRVFPLVLINMALPSVSITENNKFGLIDLLCTQYRSTSLSGDKITTDSLPLWKKFRWIYWAMEKNIWKPFEPSILCTLPTSLISNFRELFENEWAKIIENNNGNNVQEISNSNKKERRSSQLKQVPTDNWIQFNKIIPYLQCVEEYLKIYSFKTEICFTDEVIYETASNTEKRKKSGLDAKVKNGPTLVPQDTQEKFNVKVDQTTEIFLFTDQENQEDIFVDLNVVKTCPPENQSASLEKFKWYCPTQKPLWTLKTNNFASLKMRAHKGRSVFRLRFNTSMFCLRIYTNAPLRAVYFNDLLNIMDSESVRLTKYVEGLGSSFQDIIKNLGTYKFPEMVQHFFRALLQYCDKTYHRNPPVRHFIQYKFLQFILQFLKLLGNEQAKIAFQRLFILPDFSKSYDPSLKCCQHCKGIFKKEEVNELNKFLCDCNNQRNPFCTEELKQIYAAVMIQSNMKGYYVRRLRKFHIIKNTQDFENLKQALQNFYDKFFVEEPFLMFDLVRKFLFTNFEDFQYNNIMETPLPATAQIGNCYEFRKDFENSLHILTYEGKENVAFGWTPLRIGCFYCHSNTPQKYLFHTYTKSAGNMKMFIKIFRCENFTELTSSKVPNVFTMSQKDAKGGYLVVLYLYAPERVSDITWILQVGFPRYSPPGHFCDLCGLDKCHCPSDMKINRLIEKYKLVDMEKFAVFKNENTLYENNAVFVCQQQVLCSEKSLIFWFFSFEGEEPLNFKFVLTKQGAVLPLMKKKFSNRIDFFKILHPASYTLNIFYESPNQSRQKQPLKSGMKSESISTFDESNNGSSFGINVEENMGESIPIELGLWWLNIATVKGADVLIN